MCEGRYGIAAVWREAPSDPPGCHQQPGLDAGTNRRTRWHGLQASLAVGQRPRGQETSAQTQTGREVQAAAESHQ